MSATTLNGADHGLSGKCDTCGAPLEKIVSCTMEKCPIPEPTSEDRKKLLEMLRVAAR